MEEMSYEKAISRLEEIVRQLEDASTPLETAMELFKEGMALSKFCHSKLSAIEEEMNVLTENKEGDTNESD